MEELVLSSVQLQWPLTLHMAGFQQENSPEPLCSKFSLGLDLIDTDGVADAPGPPDLELIDTAWLKVSTTKCIVSTDYQALPLGPQVNRTLIRQNIPRVERLLLKQ